MRYIVSVSGQQEDILTVYLSSVSIKNTRRCELRYKTSLKSGLLNIKFKAIIIMKVVKVNIDFVMKRKN